VSRLGDRLTRTPAASHLRDSGRVIPPRERPRHTAAKAAASLRAGSLLHREDRANILKQRAADVLAYFDRPGTSNGPTEAINGRLEHLRASALGFRNLANYIARSLLETGGFRTHLHP
jgi:hypothetical protein